MSNVDWYYAKDGVRLGPVHSGLLRDMARMGTLHPRDLVWTEGMPQWRPASGVAEVFGALPYAGSGDASRSAALDYHNPVNDLFYAGFWARFGAFFIDGLILAVPISGTAFLLAAGLELHDEAIWQDSPVPVLIDVAFRLIHLLGSWLYFAIQESGPHMATIGKRLCGIAVTDLKGNRLTFARATGRHFAKLISNLTCTIGYVIAAFTEKHQALHDMVAGTLVVYK